MLRTGGGFLLSVAALGPGTAPLSHSFAARYRRRRVITPGFMRWFDLPTIEAIAAEAGLRVDAGRSDCDSEHLKIVLRPPDADARSDREGRRAHAAAEVIQWIPAVASNPGAQGTRWTTDVWLYSRVQDAATEVHIAFLPAGDENPDPVEVTVEIPAHSVRRLADVVFSMFGAHRPGALRLRSELAFEARSRTVNSGGDAGTFGQGIEAVPDGSGPGAPLPDDPNLGQRSWVLLGATKRPGNDGIRTNMGLFNTVDEGRWVSVVVYDAATGAPLVGGQLTLGAYGWFQVNLFDYFGLGVTAVDRAYVVVRGRPGIRGYLSLIDNRSGDGTFVAAADGQPVFAFALTWRMQMTLETTGDVTVTSWVDTDPDGGDVTVDDPANGMTVEAVITPPPNEFCYDIRARAGAGGGELKITTLSWRNGEPHDGHVASMGSTGAGPVNLAQCFPLN